MGIIDGELIKNNSTICGQNTNTEIEVLRYEIDNTLGASLVMTVDETTRKSKLRLCSKKGQILSEVELSFIDTTKLESVSLDVELKCLVFTFTDGTSIYCDISALIDSNVWEKGTGEHSVQVKLSDCYAKGKCALASGYGTQAEADYSHTEGFITKVSSDSEHDARYGHAEGYMTYVGGLAGHAEGDTTYTQNIGEHAEGRGNKSHKDSEDFGSAGNTISSIGIGSNNQDITTFKNALEVMQNGDFYVLGIGGYDGKVLTDAKTVQTVITEIITNLNTEITNRTNEISRVEGLLDDEKEAREAADSGLSDEIDTLTTNLSGEISRAQGEESRIESESESRDTTLQGNIDTLDGKIDSETARAEAKEAELEAVISEAGKIDDVQVTDETGTHTVVSNKVATVDLTDYTKTDYVDTQIETEAEERRLADDTTDRNLNTEINTRVAQVETLQSDLNTEASTRSQADSTLTLNLTGEIERATEAEESLGQLIQSEVQTRTEETTDLDSRLDEVESDINISVVTDEEVEVQDDAVNINVEKTNISTGTTSTTPITIPLADDTNAGVMSPSDYQTIRSNTSRIETLEGGVVRLMYTTKDNPTSTEIENFVKSKGYTDQSDWPSITVVVKNTKHIWGYYTTDEWKDDGIDTVTQFTNEVAGIIKGTATDGKVYAETNGTGSVYGWDTLKGRVQDVEDNKEEILSVEKGIVRTNNTLGLNDTFYNYLVQQTFVKPTVSTFTMTGAGTYETGSSVNVLTFKHKETNIGSITGTLTLRKGSTSGTVIKSGITPSSSEVTITFTDSEKQTITSSTTYYLVGTDALGNSFNKTSAFTVNTYAYSKLSTSTTNPTTGLTKEAVESTFKSSGKTFSYSSGQYLYLYGTTNNLKVQQYALGEWTDVTYEAKGSSVITLANGTTKQYYVYRVGPFMSSGSAQYRIC